LLHQAWGNHPDAFGQELLDNVQATLETPGGTAHDDCSNHFSFIKWAHSIFRGQANGD
jgi:hypothetical protein